MHYADLCLSCYSGGPYDAGQWASPLLTIGWLEHPHAFPPDLRPPDWRHDWRPLSTLRPPRVL